MIEYARMMQHSPDISFIRFNCNTVLLNSHKDSSWLDYHYRRIRNSPSDIYTIYGYSHYNEDACLSSKRIDFVFDYLTSKGIRPARLTKKIWGFPLRVSALVSLDAKLITRETTKNAVISMLEFIYIKTFKMNFLKLMISICFIFSLCSLCQAPDKEFQYININCSSISNNCVINDALFIINGDTIQRKNFGNSHFGYKVPSKYFINTKANIKIKHTDFETLKLDSAFIGVDRLFMLRKNESYYVTNGVKIPLKYERKIMAIKLWNRHELTPEKGQEIIDSLCNKNDLFIARNFRTEILKLAKSISSGYVQEAYGCLDRESQYTYWLQKNDSSDFNLKNKIFENIRKINQVEKIGIPQSFYRGCFK